MQHTKNKYTVEHKDDLDEKLEKHTKWAKLYFLKDGRAGYGALIYNSEEEAGLPPIGVETNKAISDVPPTSIWRIYSKPNKGGETIRFMAKEYSYHIPIPIS